MNKAYVRKKDILAVCTNDEARKYFKSKGLTYNDITEGEILMLVMLLTKELKAAAKDNETTVTSMYLSKRMDIKKKSNGSIVSCFLYLNSHYFTQRECISFNTNGFIEFAGWADQGNVNPILRAFLKWCDMICDGGEK